MAKLCENDIFALTDEKSKLKPKTGLIEITEPNKKTECSSYLPVKLCPRYTPGKHVKMNFLSLFLCVSRDR